jgi:hypothetical protein
MISDKPRAEILTTRREWLIGLTILAAWLVFMGHLVFTQVLPQRFEAALASAAIDPAQLLENWSNTSETLVVRHRNRTIGAAQTTVKKLEDESGFRADFRLGIGLNLLGRFRTMSVLGAADLNPEFALVQFHLQVAMDPVRMEITGRVSDNQLFIEVIQGPEMPAHRSRIILDRPLSLMDAVTPLALRSLTIRPGETLAVPVVDPIWSMNHGTMSFRVREPLTLELPGGPQLAFPVETRLQDFQSTLFVDENGRVLRRQILGDYFLDAADGIDNPRFKTVLSSEVSIPELNASDFVNLEALSLRGLDREVQSRTPLGLLRGLAP